MKHTEKDAPLLYMKDALMLLLIIMLYGAAVTAGEGDSVGAGSVTAAASDVCIWVSR